MDIEDKRYAIYLDTRIILMAEDRLYCWVFRRSRCRAHWCVNVLDCGSSFDEDLSSRNDIDFYQRLSILVLIWGFVSRSSVVGKSTYYSFVRRGDFELLGEPME